jgi:hypothetical protein
MTMSCRTAAQDGLQQPLAQHPREGQDPDRDLPLQGRLRRLRQGRVAARQDHPVRPPALLQPPADLPGDPRSGRLPRGDLHGLPAGSRRRGRHLPADRRRRPLQGEAVDEGDGQQPGRVQAPAHRPVRQPGDQAGEVRQQPGRRPPKGRGGRRLGRPHPGLHRQDRHHIRPHSALPPEKAPVRLCPRGSV